MLKRAVGHRLLEARAGLTPAADERAVVVGLVREDLAPRDVGPFEIAKAFHLDVAPLRAVHAALAVGHHRRRPDCRLRRAYCGRTEVHEDDLVPAQLVRRVEESDRSLERSERQSCRSRMFALGGLGARSCLTCARRSPRDAPRGAPSPRSPPGRTSPSSRRAGARARTRASHRSRRVGSHRAPRSWRRRRRRAWRRCVDGRRCMDVRTPPWSWSRAPAPARARPPPLRLRDQSARRQGRPV
ncbi:hypothetical protein T492DRAFT_945840 [Pavlovales sp. CCMP2436]|nr:hypothetical protein T492DRAFT_945840 [Pavlovales sp. CCMP2436]